MIASEEIATATSESDAASLPNPVADDLERDRARLICQTQPKRREGAPTTDYSFLRAESVAK